MKKQKKPLSKGLVIVIIVILVVAVGVLGVSVYKLLGINQSYQEANHLYDDVAALVMSQDAGEEAGDGGAAAGDGGAEAVGQPVESPAAAGENSGAAADEGVQVESMPAEGTEGGAGAPAGTSAEGTGTTEGTAGAENVNGAEGAGVTEGTAGAENVNGAEGAGAAVEADASGTSVVSEDITEPGVTESDEAALAAGSETDLVVSEEFSDSSLYVIGGHRWADPERLQRYAAAAAKKPARTAFSGFGEASMGWNFKALHDKYPDSVGWIYQKDTMSYPIVVGKTNDQYLRHMINGEYNVAGTLFVDCEYKNVLRSRYSIIYGHNMDDRSMFGSLTDYKDEEYYTKHPYFEIYVGDYMYRYHVYAAMKVAENSPLLMAPDRMTDKEFLQLIDWVDAQKFYETKAPKITKNSVVTVLATCTEYPRNYAFRNVVVLVREKILLKPIDTVGE